MDPYEVLGVRRNASDEEIKAAYKELVRKYHPDKYQNNPLADLAEEKLQEVNEAYDMLMKNRSTGGAGFGGSNAGYGGNSGYGQANGGAGDFNQVRRDIDNGNLAAAEATLNRSSNRNAEWFFLSGMVSYRKGWYDDAISKIQQACSMDPYNQEYSRALAQMMNVGRGYQNTAYGRGGSSMDDAFCQALQCYCCADFCCDCI